MTPAPRDAKPAAVPRIAPSGDDCSASEPFALRVLGDSMTPEFEDGAIIIVEPAGVIKDGAFVVADTDDGPIFRQLRMHDGRCLLRPLNPGYETLEIKGLDAVRGVVSQKAGRRRRDLKRYD